MYTFIRQFHIISSLKNSFNRDVIPFYKAPVLYTCPAVREMHTKSINKNLQLKSVDEVPNSSGQKRPLVVMLGWLFAKDVHLEKYRELYIARGFDVLTVKQTPKDFLFPATGSQVIAKHVLEFLALHQNYERILVHSFSAGGYFMGELFVLMRKDAEKNKGILSRVRGVVLDSFVDVEGTQAGVARSMAKNPIVIHILECCVSIHLALMFGVATKHYLTSSRNLHNTPLKCPVLVFVSEADEIGSLVGNRMLMESWQARGVDVRMKCWKDSEHNKHFQKYPDEYAAELDEFFCKVGLISDKL